MSQEAFEEFMGSVMREVAFYLIELGTDDPGEKQLQTCQSGDLLHLRLKDSQGKVCLQVAAEEPEEMAWQVLLAALHNISIEKLNALHKRPLRRVSHLGVVKNDSQ